MMGAFKKSDEGHLLLISSDRRYQNIKYAIENIGRAIAVCFPNPKNAEHENIILFFGHGSEPVDRLQQRKVR
jgi:hypothetical protein